MSKIYVDADAVPRAIKDVLYRAAEKRNVAITFVANSWMKVPGYGDISFVQVSQGPDEADNWIAEHAGDGDLVVTQDIPLAARVVPKGSAVIQTNGRVLDQESIDEALAMRDFAEGLRDSGFQTGGPPPFSPKHKQSFSNALDRWITRRR
ncbi:MAG: YaiI/YqxD family protein [Deltaproteobacteria bacterium]|nr:YaiI/YqxD family protein [Deltaproteobacteria bacterium]